VDKANGEAINRFHLDDAVLSAQGARHEPACGLRRQLTASHSKSYAQRIRGRACCPNSEEEGGKR
jgi:hypothetical protein